MEDSVGSWGTVRQGMEPGAKRLLPRKDIGTGGPGAADKIREAAVEHLTVRRQRPTRIR